jgi:hypothetical protein
MSKQQRNQRHATFVVRRVRDTDRHIATVSRLESEASHRSVEMHRTDCNLSPSNHERRHIRMYRCPYTGLFGHGQMGAGANEGDSQVEIQGKRA